jgi:DNA-binding LacI/PurR family transcriptional regulator
MQAAELTIHDGYEFEVPTSDPVGGQSSVGHFLSLSPRPTAIFCYNDMLAIGVLRGLQDSGLRVPEDCSVAGFDNITFSAFTNPPLTTFDQPKRTIGTQAAELVLGLLDNEEALGPKIQMLKGNLLVRGSTARPAEG